MSSSIPQQKQQSSAVSREDFPRRPKPSVWSIVPDLIRVVLQAFWTLVFHHLVTNTLIAPFFFYLVRDPEYFPRFYGFLHNSNNVVVKWASEKMTSSYLEPRGNDFSDVLIFIIGTSAVHLTTYIVVNGFFAILDIYELFQQYRIPLEPRMKITPTLIKQTLGMIVRTIFVTSPIGLAGLFLISKWRTIRTVDDIVTWNQPIHMQLLQFVFCVLFNHFFFYWSHRLFHEIPGAYKRFHSQHHEYINSISIAAEHAHPLEQIIANFYPTYGAVQILSGTIPLSCWFSWLIWRLLETFEAHSGYDFRGSFLEQVGILRGTAYWHCLHHLLPTSGSNYGQYYLDWIFGTDDAWLSNPNLACAPYQKEQKKKRQN